jgi:hypothetical protein
MKEAHQIVRGMSLRVVDGHQLHFDEVFVALCKYVALLPLVYYARVLLTVRLLLLLLPLPVLTNY